jgi:G3E family GTPase
LNRLLRNAEGRRIAVVENEFGPGLDIESLIARDGLADDDGDDGEQQQVKEAAVSAAEGGDLGGGSASGSGSAKGGGGGLTRLVELSNGCICCSVKESLVAALEELVNRQPVNQV